MPRFVFHTYYGEFSGETAEEIVQQLFEDTKKAYGPDFTMERWWEYQMTLWKLKEGKNLPARHDEPGAAEAFIVVAVEVGAL